MLDLKNLRDNFDDIKKMLSSRGYNIDEDSFKSLDKKRKVLQVTVEDLGPIASDREFLNALQSGVNVWIKNIQKVTKLER